MVNACAEANTSAVSYVCGNGELDGRFENSDSCRYRRRRGSISLCWTLLAA